VDKQKGGQAHVDKGGKVDAANDHGDETACNIMDKGLVRAEGLAQRVSCTAFSTIKRGRLSFHPRRVCVVSHRLCLAVMSLTQVRLAGSPASFSPLILH
jgi:hypothetical protein